MSDALDTTLTVFLSVSTIWVTFLGYQVFSLMSDARELIKKKARE